LKCARGTPWLPPRVLQKSGPYNRFNGNAIRNRAQKKSTAENGATIAKENNKTQHILH
jgi:hypothetical protein